MSRFFFYILSVGFALLPTIGGALDLAFKPRLQAGVMDYAFEQKPGKEATDPEALNSGDNGFKLVSSMPFLGAGVTMFANRFFLDMYVQKAFSGSDTSTNRYRDSVPFKLDIVIDSTFEREEYSLSIGYALGDQWAVFGGYREAKTQFANRLSFDDENATIKEAARSERKVDFEQDGFFLGGAYAFSVGELAVLTFNAALARLDGKYDTLGETKSEVSTEPDGPLVEGAAPFGFKFDGDTLGINLGATWKGLITESLDYTLGLNGYSYDFDAKAKDVGDLSESVTRFSAGLTYQF